MFFVMMECTSRSSELSLSKLRCVRESLYSFLVLRINVSVGGRGDQEGQQTNQDSRASWRQDEGALPANAERTIDVGQPLLSCAMSTSTSAGAAGAATRWAMMSWWLSCEAAPAARCIGSGTQTYRRRPSLCRPISPTLSPLSRQDRNNPLPPPATLHPLSQTPSTQPSRARTKPDKLVWPGRAGNLAAVGVEKLFAKLIQEVIRQPALAPIAHAHTQVQGDKQAEKKGSTRRYQTSTTGTSAPPSLSYPPPTPLVCLRVGGAGTTVPPPRPPMQETDGAPVRPPAARPPAAQ